MLTLKSRNGDFNLIDMLKEGSPKKFASETLDVVEHPSNTIREFTKQLNFVPTTVINQIKYIRNIVIDEYRVFINNRCKILLFSVFN